MDLQVAHRGPRVTAVGRQGINGADSRREFRAPFHHHRPAVEGALVESAVVVDLQGPGAHHVQVVDRRERLLGPVAAAEGRLAVGNCGLRFVVQNGPVKAVAAAPHAGEQGDPGPVRSDEINVQIGVVGVRDVDLDVQVGDCEGLVDHERGSGGGIVSDALGHIAGCILLDQRVVDRETTDVRGSGRAVSVPDRALPQTIKHLALSG